MKVKEGARVAVHTDISRVAPEINLAQIGDHIERIITDRPMDLMVLQESARAVTSKDRKKETLRQNYSERG